MRLALLSDIHGNLSAFEAVWADVQAHGVDGVWLLGDFAAMGAHPGQVLERIAALPNARFVRGNTDRYATVGARPEIEPGDTVPRRYLPLWESFSWTQGFVAGAGWHEWLAALPLDFSETFPNGQRVLCVHAAPGNDDGVGMRAGMSDDQLTPLLSGVDADWIFVGHTHWPQHRVLAGKHLVNVGSVGLPFTPDRLPAYTLLEATSSGVRLDQRVVDYDPAPELAELERLAHPARELIAGLLTGRERFEWTRAADTAYWHIVFLDGGQVALTKRHYGHWRRLAADFDGYKTSVGPLLPEHVIAYFRAAHGDDEKAWPFSQAELAEFLDSADWVRRQEAA